MKKDFIVIGGSYAGLSAALQLARARCEVLVIDAGRRRNRSVDASGGLAHGLLAQDGNAPAAIAAAAKSQLLRYPNVEWIDGQAGAACVQADGSFELSIGSESIRTRRLILATGVRDELPPVPGLAERWGSSVFNCPYCHGYEAAKGPIGIVANGTPAQHHGVMLPDWGPTTLFLNDTYSPASSDLEQLLARGVQIEPCPISSIEGVADVHLADGRVFAMRALFTQPRTHMSSPLPQQLGCEFEETSTGRFIKVNACQESSVRHVYACGDVARASGNIALAVGDGAMAGIAAHQSMLS
jgi:thioredoxin reductase